MDLSVHEIGKAALSNPGEFAALWFLSSEGRQVGPFTAVEVTDLLALGEIGPDVFVWSEGMSDWKRLRDLDLFSEAARFANEGDWIEGGYFAKEQRASEQLDLNQTSAARTNFTPAADFVAKVARESQASSRLFQNDNLDLANASAAKSVVYASIMDSRKWLGLTGIVLMLLLFAVSFLRGEGENSLTTLNAKIPLSIAESTRLDLIESANSKNFAKYTLAVAAAETAARREESVFKLWIGAGFLQNEKIHIHLSGISETLVGAFRSEYDESLSLQDGIGASSVLARRTLDPLPIGEYWVHLSCPQCGSPAGKSWTEKRKIFIGEENAEYRQKLKEYHIRLHGQLRSEIQELSQICETLERQLGETNQQFAVLGPSGHKNNHRSLEQWRRFAQQWTGLQEELNHIFEHWTAVALDDAYYYSEMYKMAQSAGQVIYRIHKEQDRILLSRTSRSGDESQQNLAVDAALAQNSLLALRSKLSEESAAIHSELGLGSSESVSP